MKVTRPFWMAVGMLSLGLGFTGIFLPFLPTTPFILLAAFSFARSSPRLHGWLLAHRRFGPLIEDWRRYGAIPKHVKGLAVAAMGTALGLTWIAGFPFSVLAVQAVVLVPVAAFVLSRPHPPRP